MADDKKTIGPDVGAPTEAPEQPGPTPDLADTAAPAPLGSEALTVEEQLILEHEGQAALFEMGEAIPDAPESPGVTIPEQAEPDKDDKQAASPGKDDLAPTGKVVAPPVRRPERTRPRRKRLPSRKPRSRRTKQRPRPARAAQQRLTRRPPTRPSRPRETFWGC